MVEENGRGRYNEEAKGVSTKIKQWGEGSTGIVFLIFESKNNRTFI